jgi:hypothetical protein
MNLAKHPPMTPELQVKNLVYPTMLFFPVVAPEGEVAPFSMYSHPVLVGR